MKLKELVVIWFDSCSIERQTVRPMPADMDIDWIAGWFSGVAEFISYRGGRIHSTEVREVKDV